MVAEETPLVAGLGVLLLRKPMFKARFNSWPQLVVSVSRSSTLGVRKAQVFREIIPLKLKPIEQSQNMFLCFPQQKECI